jgi:hypothetical protein
MTSLPAYGIDAAALTAGFTLALAIGLAVAAPYAVWSIFRRLTGA